MFLFLKNQIEFIPLEHSYFKEKIISFSRALVRQYWSAATTYPKGRFVKLSKSGGVSFLLPLFDNYSTVTDLAKLRGLSTSVPLNTAT